MQSKEIISSINTLYDRFEVPPNLRLHQFRVAGVSDLICETWIGEPLNRDMTIAAGLVHDLGNIVKWDLETAEGRSLLDEPEAQRCREIQRRIRRNYGFCEYKATRAMLLELNPEEPLLKLLQLQEPEHLSELVESSNWEAKIAKYADSRVSPRGVVSLKERFEDLLARYEHRGSGHAEGIRKGYMDLIMIETQLFTSGKCVLPPDAITNATIHPYIEAYTLNTQTRSSSQ